MNVLLQSEHFYRECIFIVRVSFARKPIKNYVKNDYCGVLSHSLYGKKPTYQSIAYKRNIQETLEIVV